MGLGGYCHLQYVGVINEESSSRMPLGEFAKTLKHLAVVEGCWFGIIIVVVGVMIVK